MKKIILFAAALAAFVACSKEQKSGTPFEKGQKVTLNIDASSSTKVTSAEDGTGISFKWEEGDIIKVSVGGNDAEFTLKTGAGESSATFEGEMPAGGDTFDVQYPYETPVLRSQTYSSTKPIPHDAMLFKATGCSLSNPSFSLTAQNAVLQLNLWGIDQELSGISFRDNAQGEVAFLLFGENIVLPTTEANAQKFYMVVPAGTYEFIVQPWDGEMTPICNISTSSAKTLTANQILNMPAKEVKTPTLNISYSVDPENAGDYEDKITESVFGAEVDVYFEAIDGYFIKQLEIKGVTSGTSFSPDPFARNTTFEMPNEDVTVKAICIEDKLEASDTYFLVPFGQESNKKITITSTMLWEFSQDDGLEVNPSMGGTDGELTNTEVTITVSEQRAERGTNYELKVETYSEAWTKADAVSILVDVANE